MVSYKPISFFEKGILQKILKASYQDFFIYFPNEKKNLYQLWEREEEEVFSNPIIGDHILFTCINSIPIGYFSWDDRNIPIGVIGQNCIIPQYQNQGYGRKQITVIEKRLREIKFTELNVVTGDHEFFVPAQKMYLACGFQKKRTFKGTLFTNIEFSKRL
jgi:GNAT superfamily N-acetyltransferase